MGPIQTDIIRSLSMFIQGSDVRDVKPTANSGAR